MADVLIVGAGPTGLVLALWLTRQGVSVRIVDKTAGPGTTSRALAVHARTLELYAQLDLAEAVVERGYAVSGARLWLQGREAARVPFDDLASGFSAYGFMHIFPQDEHERLLVERLGALGVEVERGTELIDYRDEGGHIRATLRGPDGAETTAEAAFIAGCDGARSKVRHVMGAGFPGGDYPQMFYVADVAGAGDAFNGDLNIDFDAADFLAIFPLADRRRVRLIGAVRPGHGEALDKLTFADVQDRAAHSLKLKVDEVNWFSTYRVHHRVTDAFRRGRAFLLGDAAHIHTPVGGQGMNTGIGDAINLAWKLRAVLERRAPDALLDSYEAERRAFALRLVQTTDRAFTFATAEGALAEIVRTRVAPLVLPNMMRVEAVREFVYRTISQLTLTYRGQGLDEGRAGPVHGGDRLPWVRLGDGDNYGTSGHIGWRAHVYGAADESLTRWCAGRGLPLDVYPWRADMHAHGLREDALYLLRPDTYVALASAPASVEALARYFDTRGVTP